MLVDISEPVVSLLGIGLTVSAESKPSAQSNLVTTAIVGASGASSMSSDGVLTADTLLVFDAASTMSSESNLTVGSQVVWNVSITLSGQSNLTASSQATWDLAATLSGQSNLEVLGNIVTGAASLANGGSELVANAVTARVTSAKPMSSDGNLTATIATAFVVAARPMSGQSNLTAMVYTPGKYLVLPTIEVSYTDNILLERYPIDNGQSLLITNNVGTLTTFPAQQDIADADYYFRGGSLNILDDAALAAVEAAGYGQYVVTQ